VANYADLVCRKCGVTLFLGKELRHTRNRVFGYWHGSAGEGGRNWHSEELMFDLFHFLARHVGHRLEVMSVDDLVDLKPFPKQTGPQLHTPGRMTGLQFERTSAVLASSAQDRGFPLGQLLARDGAPHLFEGYFVHRRARGVFRPVWSLLARCQTLAQPLRVVVPEPDWLSTTVTALAKAIHTDRTFSLMPVLGDALEDAGCADEDVLRHCRQQAVHHRGCWVVDLILSQE
jgi:hypothetical protein